jgi:hypothetical protein
LFCSGERERDYPWVLSGGELAGLRGGAGVLARPADHCHAAVEILTTPRRDANGRCLIDADVLAAAGVEDPARYGGGPNPIVDIFVDGPA